MVSQVKVFLRIMLTVCSLKLLEPTKTLLPRLTWIYRLAGGRLQGLSLTKLSLRAAYTAVYDSAIDSIAALLVT